LEVEPAVLNFGGFQLGEVNRLKLKVRNTAGYSTRVTLVPPTTPFFKVCLCSAKAYVAVRVASHRHVLQVNHTDRHGSIPPGLADEITVEFCAQEWRYYYDCIRIHSEVSKVCLPDMYKHGVDAHRRLTD
jgi:hypothetical protein